MSPAHTKMNDRNDTDDTDTSAGNYTCNDYRAEMILLSLQRRLNRPELGENEKKEIQAEIERVKAEMGMS